MGAEQALRLRKMHEALAEANARLRDAQRLAEEGRLVVLQMFDNEAVLREQFKAILDVAEAVTEP